MLTTVARLITLRHLSP